MTELIQKISAGRDPGRSRRIFHGFRKKAAQNVCAAFHKKIKNYLNFLPFMKTFSTVKSSFNTTMLAILPVSRLP